MLTTEPVDRHPEEDHRESDETGAERHEPVEAEDPNDLYMTLRLALSEGTGF